MSSLRARIIIVCLDIRSRSARSAAISGGRIGGRGPLKPCLVRRFDLGATAFEPGARERWRLFPKTTANSIGNHRDPFQVYIRLVRELGQNDLQIQTVAPSAMAPPPGGALHSCPCSCPDRPRPGMEGHGLRRNEHIDVMLGVHCDLGALHRDDLGGVLGLGQHAHLAGVIVGAVQEIAGGKSPGENRRGTIAGGQSPGENRRECRFQYSRRAPNRPGFR